MKKPISIFLIALSCFTAGCGGGGGGGGNDTPSAYNGALSGSDAEAVAAARAALTFDVIRGGNDAQDRIVADLDLPATGRDGTALAWRSDPPGSVAADGKVNRPAANEPDRQIVLTATVSRGSAREDKAFVLMVKRLPAGDAEAVAEDAASLTFERIQGTNAALQAITAPLNLPSSGRNGTSIAWNSTDPSAVASDGSVVRPPFTGADRPVTLTATVSRGSAREDKAFVLTVKRLPASDAEAVQADLDLLTFEKIRGGNAAPDLVTADLRLTSSGWNGTAVAWSSSSSAVGPDGRVTRPGAGTSDVPVALTATVRRGEAAGQKTFNLKVLALPVGVTFTYPGAGVAVDHPAVATDAAAAAVTYNVDVGATPKDVYFIFTNPSTVDADSSPVVTPLALDPREAIRQALQQTEVLSRWARLNGVGVSGTPAVDLFNADPWTYGGIRRLSRSGAPLSVAPLAVDWVGKTGRFYDAWDDEIPSTCRKVIAADGKTVNLWVANNAWAGGGCTKSRCVSQAMLDTLGDRFLKAGADNDIFNASTTIFGAEWGTHSYGNMISPDNTVTILLADIEGDNSLSGGILGYFYARDNFLTSAAATSNQRLLLVLDSVMFANPAGSTWEMTDYWPQEFLATLGHEMQHMIHFYQKGVLREGTSATWLNEMCSLVAEDLLATRLGIAGPRGIPSSNGTAGSPGITAGRLGRFNYYDYLSLTRWLEGSVNDSGESNRLNSYALNYAFGAYLARNYGGAGFFRNLVQNSYGDSRAVDTALSYGGYGEDFASALQKWGAATVLSDRSDAPAGYRYNTGGFIDSTVGGATFRLGSINLYNYAYGGLSGPRTYTLLPASGAGRYATSNLIYRLGTGLTGRISQDITVPRGMRLSVVVK